MIPSMILIIRFAFSLRFILSVSILSYVVLTDMHRHFILYIFFHTQYRVDMNPFSILYIFFHI